MAANHEVRVKVVPEIYIPAGVFVSADLLHRLVMDSDRLGAHDVQDVSIEERSDLRRRMQDATS